MYDFYSDTKTRPSRAMREAHGGTQAQYFSYPRKVLFDPLGMSTMRMEPDAAGTFLAPAFVYASARDWARIRCAPARSRRRSPPNAAAASSG